MHFTNRQGAMRRTAIGAGAVALVLVNAWVAWSTNNDADEVGPPSAAVQRSAVDEASSASIGEPARSPMPAPRPATPVVVASPSAVPPVAVESTVREAIDSGRAQPVFISLTGATAVRIGQLFKIRISAESENDFAAALVTLRFDPKQLRVVAVHLGDFMAQAGAAATFGHAVDAAAGSVTINVNERAGGPLVSGGGSLAIVEFIATGRGEATVSMASVALRDLNNEGVLSSPVAPHALTIRD